MRYYACEALYNIAKVAREGFMVFFHDVFDALFRLCADSEANVQNAAQFLDNLVKVSPAHRCHAVKNNMYSQSTDPFMLGPTALSTSAQIQS